MSTDTVSDMEKEISAAIDEMTTKEVTTEKEVVADVVTGDTEETNLEEVGGAETARSETEEVKDVTEEEIQDEIRQDTSGSDADEITEDVADGDKGADRDARSQTLPPVISDDTLTRAVEAGFTLADARAFRSEAALERNIASVARAAEIRREYAELEESAPVEDPLGKLPALDPENHGPEVIETFDAMKAELARQREELQGFRNQQEETSRVTQQAAAQEITVWFDKQIEGLGDDFKETLGEGGHSSLDQGSSQYAKREAIAEQIGIMHDGYAFQERQSPPREQLFEMATKIVLRDEYQKIYNEKLSGKLKKQAAQHIQHAGGAKATETLSPEETVAAEIDAKFGV